MRHVESLETDVQFESDFWWKALGELVDRDIFFGTCAFVIGLEGHVFTDFFDDGGAAAVEASNDGPTLCQA